MRKNRSLTLLLLTANLLLVSCEYDILDMNKAVIVGKIAGEQTKTSLQHEDGRYYPVWSAMDSIAVSVSEADLALFVLQGGAETRTGRFAGNADSDGDSYSAYYPYKNAIDYEDGIFRVELPAEQYYKEGSFDRGAFPMAAFGNESELDFRNLCSVVKVEFDEVVELDYIDFISDDGVFVSGKAEVEQINGMPVLTMREGLGHVRLWCEPSASEYYIAIPSQKYENGFTLKICYADGEIEIRTIADDVTFKRSEMRTLVISSDGNQGGGDEENESNLIWHWNGIDYIDDGTEYLSDTDPNPKGGFVMVGAFENGVPIDWILSGEDMGFYPSSGTGMQEIFFALNGNPSTEGKDRYFTFEIYTENEGVENKIFCFTQEGVFMEILTESNVDEFEYVNESFEDITYMFPPQQSSLELEVLTNAGSLARTGSLIDGDMYYNDKNPEFSYEWPEGDYVCHYTVSYPANYNYSVESVDFSIFKDPLNIQRFKRRGISYMIGPRIEVITDWNELTTEKVDVYDEYGQKLEKKFNLIQNEIIYDNLNRWYYIASPFADGNRSYVYAFDDNYVNYGESAVFRSNVSWDVDEDKLKEWGLDCVAYDGWNLSDGYSVSETSFEIGIAEVGYSEIYDGLYYDYIRRAPSERIESVISWLPIMLDLNDGTGYSYPVYPGFIGQGGVPTLEICFNDTPWDNIEYGSFVGNDGKKYEMYMEYSIDVIYERSYTDLLATDSIEFSYLTSPFGSTYVWENNSNYFIYMNVDSDGHMARLQHDARFRYCNGTYLYANDYIYWDKYIYDPSTKADSDCITSETCAGSELKVNVNECVKTVPMQSPQDWDTESRKSVNGNDVASVLKPASEKDGYESKNQPFERSRPL